LLCSSLKNSLQRFLLNVSEFMVVRFESVLGVKKWSSVPRKGWLIGFRHDQFPDGRTSYVHQKRCFFFQLSTVCGFVKATFQQE
jgi:hypothetical protein